MPEAVYQTSVYQFVRKVDKPNLPARKHDLVPVLTGRSDLFFVDAPIGVGGRLVDHGGAFKFAFRSGLR